MLSLAHHAHPFSPSSLTPPILCVPSLFPSPVFSCHPSLLLLLLLLSSLHPSIADPAPAFRLFIPCDITQSKNVALFGASTLLSRYIAQKKWAECLVNEVMVTRVAVNVSSHVPPFISITSFISSHL